MCNSNLPQWREEIKSSREEEGLPSRNWLQIATLDKSNKPRLRTVVFRGWLKPDSMLFYTDKRSHKFEQLKINNNAKIYWDAQIEIPIQIESKIKAKLYVSLTAVLNLTTDSAPTNPRDKANDDLTTAIKLATEIVISKILLPKFNLEEYELLKELNRYLSKRPAKIENNIIRILS